MWQKYDPEGCHGGSDCLINPAENRPQKSGLQRVLFFNNLCIKVIDMWRAMAYKLSSHAVMVWVVEYLFGHFRPVFEDIRPVQDCRCCGICRNLMRIGLHRQKWKNFYAFPSEDFILLVIKGGALIFSLLLDRFVVALHGWRFAIMHVAISCAVDRMALSSML